MIDENIHDYDRAYLTIEQSISTLLQLLKVPKERKIPGIEDTWTRITVLIRILGGLRTVTCSPSVDLQYHGRQVNQPESVSEGHVSLRLELYIR